MLETPVIVPQIVDGFSYNTMLYWLSNRYAPNALAQLRAPIYEDKVVDFILELAHVTEKKVSREDLLKDDEDEKAA